MVDARLNTVVRHIRQLAAAEAGDEVTDGQLLQRFASRGDEAAFAVLMNRHGQLIWGVCRHVLGHVHDAEDAFQATFAVLAHSATKIRKREKLASWLHGVALRVARKAQGLPGGKPIPAHP
jgi:hypothetical protein